MKVNGPNEIKTNQISRRKKAKGAGAKFSVGETTAASANSSVKGAAPLAAVDSLLSLQEVQSRNDEPLNRGHDTLDLLEEIRHGLLIGAIPIKKLEELTHLVESRRGQVSDPQLAEILDEIDLRAQVELAKYAQSRL